jgi:hypothetical protein
MFIYRNDQVYTISDTQGNNGDIRFLPRGSRVTVLFGSRPNLCTDLLTAVPCHPIWSDKPLDKITDLFGVMGESIADVDESGKWLIPVQSLITKSNLDSLMAKSPINYFDVDTPAKQSSNNTECNELGTQEREIYTESRTFHSSLQNIPEAVRDNYRQIWVCGKSVTLTLLPGSLPAIVSATDEQGTYLGNLHTKTVNSYISCLVDASQTTSIIESVIGGKEHPVYGIGVKVRIEYGTRKSQWRRVGNSDHLSSYDDHYDYGDTHDYADYKEHKQEEKAEQTFESIFDRDDALEDETAEGLGIGEIITEDVDNEY